MDNSLREKYNRMKDSAEEMALMVRTVLDQEGFCLQHPKAAEILLKYLNNLNRDINIVNKEVAINAGI